MDSKQLISRVKTNGIRPYLSWRSWINGSDPTVSTLNLALRFTLELCALAALAFWGAHVDASRATTVTLAILAPLIAAAAWGLFVSPKAQIRAPKLMQLGVEFSVFLAAAGGLVAAGEIGWALAFSAALVVHELWRFAARTHGTR